MKVFNLFDGLQYSSDEHGQAEPLHVTDTGRVLRFTFKPGQSIPEADAPSSPMFFVILKGQAVFTGQNGQQQTYGPNSLLIYEPGETFKVAAGNEETVILAVMRETEMARRESARGNSM